MVRVAAAAFVLLASVLLPADEATFVYYFAGQRAGEERITTEAGDGYTEIRCARRFTAQGRRTDMVSTARLDDRGRYLALSMEGTSAGFEIAVELAFDPDSSRVEGSISYLGNRPADMALPPEAIPLDGSLESLQMLVAAHDPSGPALQRFVYFEPLFPALHDCSIELLEQEAVRRSDEEVSVAHYFLNTSESGAHLYANRDGEILEVVLPLAALLIVRDGWEEAIEVRLPEPNLEGEALYIEEEVTFGANDVTIAGSVTVPDDGSGRHPAVVLVSGSGPQDRNADTPLPGPYGLKFGIFRTIAHRLANAGFLVLRYNDYGVAPSGGAFATHTLADRVNVARGAVRYLQGRRDVDRRRIGIVGHSEGGIIAPIVAVEDPEVRAIVLMAGTARPIDQVLLEQSHALSRSDEAFAAALPILMEGFRNVRSGADWGTFAGLENQFLGWWRSHVNHDAYDTMRRVRCRVAILCGSLDRQVLPGNALNLALALEEGGNADYDLKIFPGLDHLFMPSTTGGRTGDYADFRRRLSREFLAYIEQWLRNNLL